MGLIDILTQYDAKKKAAHAAKTVKHGVSLASTFSLRKHLSCKEGALAHIGQGKLMGGSYCVLLYL